MFRDTSEELQRLQAELLAEEEPAQPQEPPEEEPFYDEYEDTRPAQGPAVYQNYSNDYGKDLRNYASDYRAYNTDTCDDDLDEYSEDVRSGGKKGSGCLTAIVLFLLLVLVALVVGGLAYYLGYIG